MGAPVPGVCEPFYPWVLWFPVSFLQGSSWLRPAKNSDMWVLLRTLSCPRPAQQVTKPQDVRAGRGLFCSLNSLPTPNSLMQTGKLRPASIAAQGHTAFATDPTEAESPLSRLAGLPRKAGLRKRPGVRADGAEASGPARTDRVTRRETDRRAHRLGGFAADPRASAHGPANEKRGKKGTGTSASGKGVEPAGRAGR